MTTRQPQAKSDLPSPGYGAADRLGGYLHDHERALNGPLGRLGIRQVGRSMLASFAMMLVAVPAVCGIELLGDAARTRRLFLGNAALNEVVEEASRSPLKSIVFMASGFTLYRSVTKLFNQLYDPLVDPHASRADTVAALRDLPRRAHEAAWEIVPLEAQSVPLAAVGLGMIRSLYRPPVEAELLPGAGNRLAKVLFDPHAKTAQQAIIDGIGYTAFFEWADRGARRAAERRSGIAPPRPEHEAARLVFRRTLPTLAGITLYTLSNRASKVLTGHLTGPITPMALADMEGDFAKKLGLRFFTEWAAISTFCCYVAPAEKLEHVYDALLTKLNQKYPQPRAERI